MNKKQFIGLLSFLVTSYSASAGVSMACFDKQKECMRVCQDQACIGKCGTDVLDCINNEEARNKALAQAQSASTAAQQASKPVSMPASEPSAGGLSWSKPTSDELDWESARRYCSGQGKRLPTLSEFKVLLNSGVKLREYGWNLTPVWTSDSEGANVYTSVSLSGAFAAPAYYNPNGQGVNASPNSLLSAVCVK